MRENSTHTQWEATINGWIDALRAAALMVPLGLALVGCDRAADPAAAAAVVEPVATSGMADAPSTSAPPAALLGTVADADVPPPTDSAALQAVYGSNAGQAVEYALPDGRQVGFWHGYAYRSGAEPRYTAFVHSVAPNDGGIAPPGQQVELAQITYTLRNGVWQPGKPQLDVGRFGGSGQPPAFDADRLALTYEASATRALLALPSVVTATGGVELKPYELFTLNDRGDWHHAGTVQAGADYSASCKDGPATPDTACVRNIGRLRFDQATNGAMPAITVNVSGSIRGKDGAIRPSGAEDARTYRYDDATGGYVEAVER